MKLALGTVQFGLNYGVSNQYGMTSKTEVRNILSLAHSAGIDTVDTAHGYGESEAVLGESHDLTRHFRVITKTRILRHDAISDADINLVNTAFEQSCQLLRQRQVGGLLIHLVDDMFSQSGERLYHWLMTMRDAGKVQKIGASVYSPEEAERLLAYYDIDLIQIPLNLMDQRMVKAGLLDRFHAQGIEVHVRSAFLQGLFFMPPADIPETLAHTRSYIEAIQRRSQDAKISISTLALSFLKQFHQIDRIVIGVNTADQLTTDLEAYFVELVDSQLFDGFASEDLTIINPSTWKVTR